MSLMVWEIINGFFSSGPSQSLSAAQLQLLQQAAQAQAVQAQAAKAEAAKVLAHATAQGTAGKTVAQGKCYDEVLSKSKNILPWLFAHLRNAIGMVFCWWG